MLKGNNAVIRSATSVLKKNTGLSVLLVTAACGAVAASLVPPQILKLVIDRNLVPGSSAGLLVLAVVYMGSILFSGLFDFIKEAVLTVLGQKIMREIRSKMMFKLGRTGSRFFTDNESGIIVSRFTNDVDAINTLFTSGIVGMAVDCFRVVGIVVSIWLFSAMLGVTTVVLLPVIYAITRLFQRRMLKAQIDNRVIVGRVNNHISESLKNILMIKAFGKEAFMEEKYRGHLFANYRTLEKVNFYDAIFSPIIQVIRAVVIALIVVLSAGRGNYLGISLGMVAATIELFSGLFTPVENLGMALQDIQQAISGIFRVNEFFSGPEDTGKDEGIKAEDIIPHRKDARLEFDDVTFGYEEDVDVLKNISLKISPQEKVTFVGRTGVGKTTLFKLITGLLEPTSGNIRLNGKNVFSIPNSEKRKIFGYVDQSFYLVKGTIAEQISLRDEDITREQITAALEFTGLKDYVDSLENGLDTQITNDSIFSQGQKQLLAIARAIVTDPPILLLDEITANLDSITEDKIVRVLQRASQAHMILSISHRLSSMIASDTVVILENGRVKNAGSPEILLESDEWYRNRLALERLTWG
ncbi:MAG TPA: ABC transporter ATP-binding protein [Clostridia bacterium]|nr:ABC transporter ATP-binding protein [Clostridia bacterium]